MDKGTPAYLQGFGPAQEVSPARLRAKAPSYKPPTSQTVQNMGTPINKPNQTKMCATKTDALQAKGIQTEV